MVMLMARFFVIFLQVTNQIVLACKEYIQQCTVSVDDEDQLWQKVQQETATAEPLSSSQQKHLQTQLDNRLKVQVNIYIISLDYL